jgi:uncharacterized protein (TIGR03790 family)
MFALAIVLLSMTVSIVFAQSVPGVTALPSAPPRASATYLGLDTTTLGSWAGHYGSDGYIIPNSSTRLPSYVQLGINVNPSRNACSEPECLKPADGTSRTWNQWVSPTSFTIDINLTDGRVHKISFYTDDLYNGGLNQNLTIKEATTGAVLSTQTVSDLRGVYQIWEVGGHVIVVVTNRLPNLYVLINGIFFDPPPPVTRSSYLIVPAAGRATPMAIRPPTDPAYSAVQLGVRAAGLPSGGTVTLADGATPVTVGQDLSVAQLTSLKFSPSAATTTASRFIYQVSNPAGRRAVGDVLIVAESGVKPPTPPTCSDTAMEWVPVIRKDGGQPVSLLVPRSGIIPSEIAVLINDSDPKSVIAGQYFQRRHHIPEANVIHLTVPLLAASGANFTISLQDFAALKAGVDARLSPRIQAYALSWTQPYRVSGGVGITSAFTYGYAGGEGGRSHYYNTATYQPSTDFQIRPAMMLAGYTAQDVVSLIDRGASAQQTLPIGNGYFVRTPDGARSVRYPDFISVVDNWAHPHGLKMTYLDDAVSHSPDYIQNTAQVLFYETGLQAVPGIDTNRYVAGAIADHLTSFGGELLQPSGQMSILSWIQAGATASYGTVTEPTANPYKFPRATVLVAQYFAGNTAVEAYNKSVAMPYQGVFVGDPLARPFGTTASVAGGVLSIKTSILRQGTTYSLLASNSCKGPFTTLQSDILPSLRSFAVITNKTGPYTYFELIEN